MTDSTPAIAACVRGEAALTEAIGKVWEAVRAIEPDPRDGRPAAAQAQIVSRDLTVLVSQLSRGRYAVEDLRHNLAVLATLSPATRPEATDG